MRITEEQQERLLSFKCERLSSNDDNFRRVDDFFNKRNNRLVETLQNEAYSDDEHNRLAYYVVKSALGNIVFFFSLKCGLLYDEFIEGERLQNMEMLYRYIQKMSHDKSLSDRDRRTIATILEKVNAKKEIKKKEIIQILKLSKDESLAETFGENIKHVGRTFPGLEIVHFCANDTYRKDWEVCNFPQKMGVTFFWHFIVPKVLEVMGIVGCEYLFLFAADLTENAELVNYYSDHMGFQLADRRSAAIPMYDLTCQFMSQETKELEQRKVAFFDSFNPDEEI